MNWYPALIERRRSDPRHRTRWGQATLSLAALLAAGAVAATAAAATGSTPVDASGNYNFSTLNNHKDPTFNQLLGINNSGVIAGYFGSGAKGHPNRGYLLQPPYGQGSYLNENFPGSSQTQVTGIDNSHITVGFWVDAKGNNFGFYAVRHKHFHKVDFPGAKNANPQVDQLLGVNDQKIAVGFYTDPKGNNHGYTYNINRRSYKRVNIGGATSVTAAAINNLGDIAGFETTSGGTTEAFLRQSGGHVLTLSYPGATMTQAFGVNDGDEVVGSYTVGSGSSATTHGFVWVPGLGFENVDDPSGVGATTINGVNDRGQLVGFYTDSSGNTDGMLATPKG